MDKDFLQSKETGYDDEFLPLDLIFNDAFPSPGSGFQDAGSSSHDISQMLDCWPNNGGHRRSLSVIIGPPDDTNFDTDHGNKGSSASLSDKNDEDWASMFIDLDKIPASSKMDEWCLQANDNIADSENSTVAITNCENSNAHSHDVPMERHRHNLSINESITLRAEMWASGSEGSSSAGGKKVISADELAELALVNPKRAKRILANRESAARSRERKTRHIALLEQKAKLLKAEATKLSAQLAPLKMDTNDLNVENNGLKLHMQSIVQQISQQDNLNNTLWAEVQRLRVAAGLASPNGGQTMNPGSSFRSHQPMYHQQTFVDAHQLQQFQFQSPNSGQTMNPESSFGCHQPMNHRQTPIDAHQLQQPQFQTQLQQQLRLRNYQSPHQQLPPLQVEQFMQGSFTPNTQQGNNLGSNGF